MFHRTWLREAVEHHAKTGHGFNSSTVVQFPLEWSIKHISHLNDMRLAESMRNEYIFWTTVLNLPEVGLKFSGGKGVYIKFWTNRDKTV